MGGQTYTSTQLSTANRTVDIGATDLQTQFIYPPSNLDIF